MYYTTARLLLGIDYVFAQEALSLQFSAGGAYIVALALAPR